MEPPFPPEVWELIFRYCSFPDLKRLRLVCHRWNAIVMGCPSLWHRFQVRFWPITESLSPAMLPPVKRAIFECDVQAVSSWWPSFGGKLEELSFNGGDISLTALFGMLKHCTNLKRLSFTVIWLLDGDVDYEFSLECMEEINIYDIQLNGIELPYLFAAIFPCVKRFSLYYVEDWQEPFGIGCWIDFINEFQSTLQSLDLTSEFFLVKQLSRMNRLQLLKYVMLDTDCSPNPWDGKFWSTFCRSQQSLQGLRLVGTNISNEILSIAVQSLPNLRNLHSNLCCSHQIVPTFLHSPAILQFASICGFPAANLQFRTWLSPTLTELTLMCAFIGDGIEYLINSPNIIKIFLADCDLTSCRVPNETSSVLRNLRLCMCKMQPQMFDHVLSCHPRLEKAGFSSMEFVDKGAIVKLLRASPKLREIRSNKCPLLESASEVDIMQDYYKAVDLPVGSREVRFHVS